MKMAGSFFGYEEIGPCPHCGTPRVGADWDDSYYIVPGRLVRPCRWGQHGQVIISLHPDWGHYSVEGEIEEDGIICIGTVAKGKFTLRPEDGPEAYKDYLGEWTHCPECGEALVFSKIEWLGSIGSVIGHCPAKGKKPEIEHLPGCPKCCECAHGAHFAD